MRRRHLLGLAAAAIAPAARAQGSWPERPIRMIVPFPAGGATDIWARMTAEGLSPLLGQQVVVENRSGAGGMVGTEAAARAAPDGYTLLFTITTHVQSPVVFRRWPYRPLEDFAPIGRFGTTPLPFVIRADIPAQTLKEFVEWARGRDLSFGSYAPGSTGHAMAQLLNDVERLGMTHIAYRGEAPMLTDMLGGRIACGFHSMTAAGDYIRGGRLRPLACLGRERIPSLPQVPTFIELGYPEAFAFSGFIGLLAPARVPQPILDRLAEAFRQVMAREDINRRLREMDTLPGYMGPAEFREHIARVWQEWEALATSMNLTVDG
ncbi:Bug family tripartite tricarboxylate transporter substrate binding protein [Crenalkalicoccus roseus]|uniref:Bug family tripartite tricarboxylate transporter substrate binding protein n=1 Tax=Crenalkalicoccus roseus TaxID=1485588 RepID=UPI0010807C68|nr:tripartite tricarboxylate transporter substrate binding protein [Crenalkalicoccus roseus]